MNKKLLISIVSLVVVLALGVGATYALFTSNTVTISANTLTTGEATIKLCNKLGLNDWRNTLSPVLILTDMIPGGTERELTGSAEIYLGNDNGVLGTNNTGGCVSYFDAAGHSDVAMRMIPKVSNLNCPGVSVLGDQLELRFDMNGSSTGYAPLSWWVNNIGPYTPTFNPGETARVLMYARLVSGAAAQKTTCTFDVTFTGEQVL